MPKILVLNDIPEILHVRGLILTFKGFQHLELTDAHEALRVLRQEPIDLFIQDLFRPGINGFDLYWLIKSDQMLRDIPILIDSACCPVAVTKAKLAGRTLECIHRVKYERYSGVFNTLRHVKKPHVLYVEGFRGATGSQDFVAAIAGILEQCSRSSVKEERARFFNHLATRFLSDQPSRTRIEERRDRENQTRFAWRTRRNKERYRSSDN